MGFSGAKIAPCPPYTPLGTIESSKGLRPSRALPSFLTVWASLRSYGCCRTLGNPRETPQSPSVTAPLSGKPIRRAYASPERGRSDCRKTPGELERVATLSKFQSRPAACTVGTGRFLRRKSHFPEQKSFPCSFCARKSLRFQQKLVRVVGRLKTLWVFRFRPWRNCRWLKSKI